MHRHRIDLREFWTPWELHGSYYAEDWLASYWSASYGTWEAWAS